MRKKKPKKEKPVVAEETPVVAKEAPEPEDTSTAARKVRQEAAGEKAQYGPESREARQARKEKRKTALDN